MDTLPLCAHHFLMTHSRLYLMAFFTRLWYAFSQFFTGFGGARIPHYENVGGIAAVFLGGRLYRKDRRAGALTHPNKVQARLNRGVRIGDCEDHAGYWCKSLRESLLSFELYMGHLYYVERDGTNAAHAVAVYRKPDTADYYWCDYGVPRLLTSRDAWPEAVLPVYGQKLRGAFMFRVDTTGVRGQLRFGDITTFPLQ